MKKKLIALIATIMLLLFTLCGCNEKICSVSDRFFVVENLGSLEYIICDRETGVLYLYMEQSNRVAITVLLDKDGKPLLYEGELK